MDARRVSDTWRQGATGEWAAQAAWVSGARLVASRRLRMPRRATSSRSPRWRSSASFAPAASTGPPAPSRPAAARARSSRCSRPPRRRRSPESFYGLLARETLGMETKLAGRPVHRPRSADRPICPTSSARWSWPGSASRRWPRRCFATRPRSALRAEHHALIQLAKQLDLPAAQLWLANNGQPGARSDADRPLSQPALEPAQRLAGRSRPRLRPHRPGIRLPPHRRQHRRRGRPDAGAADHRATDVAQPRRRPTPRAALTDPRFNLEFGQSFIEMMRGIVGDRRSASARHRLLQCRAAPGRALGGDQRQGRSAAVDRIHPLLGDALLRARRCFGTCGSIRASTTRARRP